MAEGRVLVNQRRHFIVESDDGDHVRCIVKGRKLVPVAGDRVQWVSLDSGNGLIETIHDRRNVLCRYDSRRGKQPMAANLDQLLIVTAIEPAVDLFLLDKYLVAAAASDLEAIIILNKTDLLTQHDAEALDKNLAEYSTLGYSVVRVSAKTGDGLETFSQLLKNKVSAMVGASGVGKSSLIKWLLPELDIRIGEISTARQEGRHTTTSSQLYTFSFGGDLIDSPGVRDFMLWPMPVLELKEYFVEFQTVTDNCKFADCVHLNEPHCAIQAAVQTGQIQARRYDSYRGLARIMQAQYEANRF